MNALCSCAFYPYPRLKPIQMSSKKAIRQNKNRSLSHTFRTKMTQESQKDGFARYRRLPKPIRVVGCLGHPRRKYVEALIALKQEDRKGTAAERGVLLYDALFALEEKWHDLEPDERKNQYRSSRIHFADEENDHYRSQQSIRIMALLEGTNCFA